MSALPSGTADGTRLMDNWALGFSDFPRSSFVKISGVIPVYQEGACLAASKNGACTLVN